jgi:serine/threonine protein kinase
MKEFPRSIGGFEILGSLGQGGMGIVYCARDTTLQRELAIKVQSGDWAHHPEVKQRFLREARILARINHPHVVQIYSVGEHEGAPFFVMELLEGSVADAARVKLPGIRQLKRWMLEAARGLAAIHEMGVVHRDIKPANLLLTRVTSVEEEHIKVADLGIASAGDLFGARLTQVGAVLGTTGYLAPESFRVEHTLDSRADQYSLGVVFYELLARRGPYQEVSDTAMLAALIEPRAAPDVREFRPEVDASTAHILATMLKHHPDDRFENTAALVQALTLVQSAPERMTSALTLPMARVAAEPLHQALPLQTPPPPPPTAPLPAAAATPPLPPTVTRQRPSAAAKSITDTQAAVIVVMVILLFVATMYALYSWSHAPAPDREPPNESAFSPATEDAAAETHSLGSLQRTAWAKYLLGRYQLLAADDGGDWTLDFLDQESGVIAAQLHDPGDDVIELSGQVQSQTEETIDGEEWDVYQVELTGSGDIAVTMRIMLSDTATAGEGAYTDGAQSHDFTVESSEDL